MLTDELNSDGDCSLREAIVWPTMRLNRDGLLAAGGSDTTTIMGQEDFSDTFNMTSFTRITLFVTKLHTRNGLLFYKY